MKASPSKKTNTIITTPSKKEVGKKGSKNNNTSSSPATSSLIIKNSMDNDVREGDLIFVKLGMFESKYNNDPN